jgi:hypothetical protein
VTGTVSITFSIYDTPTGGVPLWTEPHDNVTVSGGLFNLILGSINPIDDSVLSGGERYFELTVNGELIEPRQQIVSVLFALKAQDAETLEGHPAADFAATSEVVKSINSLKGDVTLAEGENVTITKSGNTLTISATSSGGGNTLDQAYDQGGAGAGRTINADAGAVNIAGTDGLTVNGNVGIGTTSPSAKLHLQDGSVLFAGLPIIGSGAKMMWLPEKAAFRAGEVSAEQWDANNIGLYSVAVGLDTQASGEASTAMGNDARATGRVSTAIGISPRAKGNYSTAIGNVARAEGTSSTAIGNYVTVGADSYSAIIIGEGFDVLNPLVNNVADSLMVGFKSDIPTLFVGQSSGLGTTGNVGIGTKNPAYKLDVNGTIRGDNVNPSDVRLKKAITPINNALERVTQLRGVNYKWIDETKGEELQMGVIAQEVEAIFPEVVSTDDEGYKSVAYNKLVSVLIEAIKELKAENEALKQSNENTAAKLEQTNAELESLKAKMIQIEASLQQMQGLGMLIAPKENGD